ncbi:MAG: shikimate dehydrogenase [Nocardioidaceae bacterium]
MDGYRNHVLAGLVGAGIATSLTPALHEREADRLGLRCVYQRFDITELGLTPADVGTLVGSAHRTGFTGLNITHPCKQLVIDHLDALSPDAVALGAVNTVVFEGPRAVGHNTDWSGFAHSFARGLPDVATQDVVLLGAGGAGAAVAHALLTLGADLVTVVDTDPGRADLLARALRERFGRRRAAAAPTQRLDRLLAAADGLVHATPTGMAAHPGLPLPAALLRAEHWVADIVYRPLETELVQLARSRGCRTLDGGGMAVYQAVDAFELFSGVVPDPDRMTLHFAELVAGTPAGPGTSGVPEG